MSDPPPACEPVDTQSASGSSLDMPKSFPWERADIERYLARVSDPVDASGHLVTRALLALFKGFVRMLSWRATDRLGTVFGTLLYWLGIRREVARVNLDIAFGETLSPGEKTAIYKATMQNMGRHVLNYLRVPQMDDAFWADFTIEGEDLLREVYNRGKGVVFIGGHIGEWEIACARAGVAGYPISMVAKRLRNPVFNEFIVEARLGMQLGTVTNRDSMDRILKGIKEHGEGVTMAIDQSMKRSRSVFVDFLGRIASAPRSVAWIARETGAPVVAGYACRTAPATYKLVVTEEIPWVTHPDPDEELVINARKQVEAVERIIREHPELWLWIHRRWKTQPEGVPHPYRT